jgi:ABC-type nitrate/sulfonate/bicarbonate transport system substrate-binding protein
MSISRRKLIGTGLAMAAVKVPGLHAETLAEVRIGVLRSGLFTVIHALALQGGYYQRNGVKPRVTELRSGDGMAGAESLLRGSLDVFIGTPVELTRVNAQAVAQSKDPPLAIVAAGAPNFTNLVLRKGIAYQSFSDLKGLRLGVSSPGSDHLVNFRHLLSEQGLTTEQLNIRILPLGSSNMLTAITSSQIDGFLHSEPTVSIALVKAQASLAISSKQFGIAGNSPGLAVNVARRWEQSNRENGGRVVKALWDASIDYGSMPKQKVLEVLQSYVPSEPEILARAYGNFDPRLHDLKQMADAWWKVNVSAMMQRGGSGGKSEA